MTSDEAWNKFEGTCHNPTKELQLAHLHGYNFGFHSRDEEITELKQKIARKDGLLRQCLEVRERIENRINE